MHDRNKQFKTHRPLDIFASDRVKPSMVQVFADSPSHSLLIHSIPYREPVRNHFKRHKMDFSKIEYDKFSWVKISRVDSEEIVIESLMEPIFSRSHE